MRFLIFIPNYLWWHYTKAIHELLNNESVFLKFVLHFFSVRNLLSTLFAPWERMGEQYQGGFDLSRWAETFLVNMILRVVGFVIRGSTVVIGLLVFASVFIVCVIIFVSWILVPLVWLPLLFIVLGTIV